MGQYIGDTGGVNRMVSKPSIGDGSIARKVTEGWAGENGVARKFFNAGPTEHHLVASHHPHTSKDYMENIAMEPVPPWPWSRALVEAEIDPFTISGEFGTISFNNDTGTWGGQIGTCPGSITNTFSEYMIESNFSADGAVITAAEQGVYLYADSLYFSFRIVATKAGKSYQIEAIAVGASATNGIPVSYDIWLYRD